MSLLVRLALRNLFRQKRRTVLTFVAVAVGLLVFIIEDSLTGGINNDATENLVNLDTGHIRISAQQNENEGDDLSLTAAFKPTALLKTINQLPSVLAATPRIRFSASLNNGRDEMPVIAIGVDPTTYSQVYTTEEYVTGRLPAGGAAEAVVGKTLAELMDIAEGDMFTLVMRTVSQSFQAIDLTIVGIVNSPHPQLNDATVLLPLDVAAGSVGVTNQATDVAIRLDNSVPLPEVRTSVVAAMQHLGQPFAKLQITTWEDQSQDFRALTAADQKFDFLFMGLIMLIATVGIVNSVLLGAMERTREIGMMKALGMREGEIVREFLIEAFFIGLLGGVTGIVVALAIEYFLVKYGINLGMFIGDLNMGYPISTRLYGQWNIMTAFISLLFAILTSQIAAYIPASRAARMDPVVALRHD